jgi:hypothetical protein
LDAEAFDYLDYHRTIIGYHGTTAEIADRLVAGVPFKPSGNTDDWLGTGVYFWEYAPKQAWWWAEKFKKIGEPAVIGAMIRLGNCLDLLDPENLKLLREMHDVMMVGWKTTGEQAPRNGNQHKNLDCAVFNDLYRLSDGTKRPIDTARAVYVPTEGARRIWERSWIYEQAHLQICVRNPRNILAVWHVGRDGRYGKEEREGPAGD